MGGHVGSGGYATLSSDQVQSNDIEYITVQNHKGPTQGDYVF